MKTYTTIQGDTWDAIAKNQLGSEKFTDKLVAVNFEQRKTMFFSSGIVLNLPEVSTEEQTTASEGLPPWKR